MSNFSMQILQWWQPLPAQKHCLQWAELLAPHLLVPNQDRCIQQSAEVHTPHLLPCRHPVSGNCTSPHILWNHQMPSLAPGRWVLTFCHYSSTLPLWSSCSRRKGILNTSYYIYTRQCTTLWGEPTEHCMCRSCGNKLPPATSSK